MKHFYVLWAFVGLMYLGACLSVLGTLAIIAMDEYPELVQVAIVAGGFSSAFMCAFWGDYVRLQLTMYDLEFTKTEMAVRAYKAGIARPAPVIAKGRIKSIVPANGGKQRKTAQANRG